jgi:hypothetical protein
MPSKQDPMTEEQLKRINIDELRTYVRWSRVLYWGLVMGIASNAVLTYWLLFHTNTANTATCAPFCSNIHSNAQTSSEYYTSLNRRDDVDASTIANVAADDLTPGLVVRDTEVSNLTSTAHLADLEKRWDYGDIRLALGLGMTGYWVANQGIQWWNMYSACNDFTGSPSNAVNCVWGAVTTAITAGGTLWGFYVGAGHISNYMNNNAVTFGWKRDSIDAPLLKELSDAFGTPVNHLGIWNYHPSTFNSTYSRQASNTTTHVFGVNLNGTDHHFAYIGATPKGLAFRLGFGLGDSSEKTVSIKGRKAEEFNTQFFLSGGIDFYIDPNPDNYPYAHLPVLNPATDYGYIFDQVSCNMKFEMSAQGHWFQLYDNVHRGTLVAGMVAPFAGKSKSVISTMPLRGSIRSSLSCKSPSS